MGIETHTALCATLGLCVFVAKLSAIQKIRQSIVVKIANANTNTVVAIFLSQNIKRIRFRDLIDKLNSHITRENQPKQSLRFFCSRREGEPQA